MVRKPVHQQRVGAHIPRSGDSVRNSNRLLPDRPRIGHLKNFCSGVKKLSEVGEINMGANVIGSEVLHRIKRSEIDPLRDLLPSLNLQRRLSAIGGDRRNRLTFASAHLESKPGLTIGIVEIDITSGQIRDAEGRHDRFVSDVLQTLEFQIHLNLSFTSSYGEQQANKRQCAIYHAVNYRNSSQKKLGSSLGLIQFAALLPTSLWSSTIVGCNHRTSCSLMSRRGAYRPIALGRRDTLGRGKKLQQLCGFRLNGLQFVIVINQNPVTEIPSLTASRGRTGLHGSTFLPHFYCCRRGRQCCFR